MKCSINGEMESESLNQNLKHIQTTSTVPYLKRKTEESWSEVLIMRHELR